MGEWTQDRDGYYIGLGELRFTPNDAARFGLLYLNDDEFEGKRVISAEWVRES